jgi:hypothetical protein
MKRLRLATPEEIDAIRDNSDLDPTCIVLGLDTAQGVPLAVVRVATEVDPIHFPKELPDRMKAMFVRDIETFLSAKGVPTYYFNIVATDEAWINIVKAWGVEQISKEPELRFKRTL